MQAAIEDACRHLPEGWEVTLCLERGAAFVSLTDPDGNYVALPDSTDKSLVEQVQDALLVAAKWLRHGDWRIWFEPPPTPTRSCDWQFVHDGYDGPGDWRHGSAASVEDAIAQIEELEEREAA